MGTSAHQSTAAPAAGLAGRAIGSENGGMRSLPYCLLAVAVGACSTGPSTAEPAAPAPAETSATPAQPRVTFEDAYSAYQRNDLRSAIGLYSRLIEQGDAVAEAHRGRGICYQKLGDRDQALADFDEACRADPFLADAFANRGVLRFGSDPTGAAADFERVARLRPSSTYAWHYLGIARQEAKDYEGAVAAYSQALEIEPNAGSTLYSMGTAYHAMKDFDGAIRCYTAAVLDDPTSVSRLTARAMAYADKGERIAALADYERIIELGSPTAPLLFECGNLKRALGDYPGADIAYSEAFEIDATAMYALMARGETRLESGNLAGAESDFFIAIDYVPGMPEAHYRLAQVRTLRGDYGGALSEHEQVLQLGLWEGHDPALDWFYRGMMAAGSGDLASAIQAYTEVIKAAPNNDLAFYLRGTCHAARLENQIAIEDYTRAIGINPRAWTALEARATARKRIGDDDGAQADRDRARTIRIESGRKPRRR